MADLTKPDKYTQHYCRDCIAEFKLGDVGAGSPHLRAFVHAQFAHNRELPSVCTNRCELRATPDERQRRQRVYGPGLERKEPLVRIEELQSEDDHA